MEPNYPPVPPSPNMPAGATATPTAPPDSTLADTGTSFGWVAALAVLLVVVGVLLVWAARRGRASDA